MWFIKKILIHIINKIAFGSKVVFNFTSTIRRGSKFEGHNKIYDNSYFSGQLGRCSYISINCYIIAKVGKFTSIGPNCITAVGRHPYTYPYVCSSPAIYSVQKQCGYTFATEQQYDETVYADVASLSPVVIGNDCWINAGVIIVGGVTIGDGAVILAGSVVTKDVPPYAIVGGSPAKVIKYRYNEDDIRFLLDSKWWTFDDAWMKANYKQFSDINRLKLILGKK